MVFIVEKKKFPTPLQKERGVRNEGPTGAPHDLKRLKPERLQRRGSSEAEDRRDGAHTLSRGVRTPGHCFSASWCSKYSDPKDSAATAPWGHNCG